MKKLITPIVALFFAGGVYAATDAEIYHGFAEGNMDLASDTAYGTQSSAVQPGIGSGVGMHHSGDVDHLIYRGFEVNNPDLWSGGSSSRSSAVMPGIGSSNMPGNDSFRFEDIYHGYATDNMDL